MGKVETINSANLHPCLVLLAPKLNLKDLNFFDSPTRLRTNQYHHNSGLYNC